MKADKDVQMIAAEAPVFARACEMFILELTHRAWTHAEKNKRQTLQKNDIAAAISRTDIFDFLYQLPRGEGRNEAIPKTIPGRAIDSNAESVPNPIADATPYQATYQHLYHQKQQLRTIWANQYREIEQTKIFGNHNLPLARIKKIMKADENV
ncbi:hypothetical protein IEQ34_008673 [Dendrobium chrysotoxum]|uniref:Core Histone H2A/H2B/H3 domain-containing protein n=1 Tax=Dendrobium chrysotoxum TaxID=161865 RepID=A0AAV7GZK7_DENCH|nr:hypothetical protein IEQ34_008673 [Dendrobium chrysotoxum]